MNVMDPQTPTPSETRDDRLSQYQIAFIVAILMLGTVLLGWTVYSGLRPRVPTSDLARDATAYLRFRKAAPLSEPLREILADPRLYTVPTQPHALLGSTVPDFVLADHAGNPVRLSALTAKGPVVLVFYLGYFCDHCVAQLFSINEDIAKFRELGAQVLAISPDSGATTAAQFKRYGAFAFPVLSDPDHRIAGQFGVYVSGPTDPSKPLPGPAEPKLYHATLLIGRDRKLHWANVEEEPFLHNKSLLFELARLEDRLPRRPG